MHNPSSIAVEAEQVDTKFGAVPHHLPDLCGSARADDVEVFERFDWRSRRGVIHRRQRQFGPPYSDSEVAKHCKRLWCRDLVNQVEIDV